MIVFAVCSRNAGKELAVARRLMEEFLIKGEVTCYFTSKHQRERIISKIQSEMLI